MVIRIVYTELYGENKGHEPSLYYLFYDIKPIT